MGKKNREAKGKKQKGKEKGKAKPKGQQTTPGPQAGGPPDEPQM